MESFTKVRTGKSPVTFAGERIAKSSGCVVRGRQQNRWHNLELFRTAAGVYVVVIEFQTCWQGEQNRSTVEVVNTAEEVVKALEQYDSTDGFCPYPEYPGVAGKSNMTQNEKIAKDLRVRYQAQVSEILEADVQFRTRIA